MMAQTIIPIAMMALGALCVYSSVANAGWFMNNRRALMMRQVLGDALTRIFYGTIGFALAVVGTLFLIYGFQPQ